MFELGSRVKDKITGAVGVVIARTLWVTGCTTYGVQVCALKDGIPCDPMWIDEVRLETVKGETIDAGPPSDNGGPHAAPRCNVKGC